MTDRLQEEERLGFPSDLFETATQFSQERESHWPKRACRPNGHRCEVVALVEGCIFAFHFVFECIKLMIMQSKICSNNVT